MFCPMCGAPNEEDAVYCGNCGAAIQETPPEESGGQPATARTDAAPALLETVPAAQEAAVETTAAQVPPEPALPEIETRAARTSPPVAAHPVTPTSGLAIASLVLGVGGLTVLPLLGSIAAIIVGYMARSEIRRRPGELAGDGMALAGIILGWVPVVAGVLVGLLALLGIVASVCGLGLFGLTGGSLP